jgi:hypothetical protein
LLEQENIMAVTIERSGARVYFTGDTFSVKDRIKQMGGHWDGDRRAWWVGATKAEEAQALVASLTATPNLPRTKQDPSEIRLTGKGRYKGREYYAGSMTRDGLKVRLLTLPDAKGGYLDFWALCSEVEQTKTYHPREYRGRTQYTTLGGIAAFIRESREADRQIAAGEIPDGYCVDNEDGMVKRRSECDMPAD